MGQHHTKGAAQTRQQHGFRQQLSDNATGPSAHGKPNGNLSLACRGAR